VLNFGYRLGMSSNVDVRDNALRLLEFIKEFYMNYPLRGHESAILGSTFDELEFFSLQDLSIKKYHRSVSSVHANQSQILSRSLGITGNGMSFDEDTDNSKVYETLKGDNPEVMEYFHSTNSEDTPKTAINSSTDYTTLNENEERKLWNAKSVHLAFNNTTIISIVESPYLSSRIIVRDMTGKHAWLMTEHRVLDYNCLNTIDYNDKAAVYRNALEIKGDQKFKELVDAKKTVVDLVKEEEKEVKSKIEAALKTPSNGDIAKYEAKYIEEINKVKNNDILLKALNFLYEQIPTMQKVFNVTVKLG
jgi:hypothetical protein